MIITSSAAYSAFIASAAKTSASVTSETDRTASRVAAAVGGASIEDPTLGELTFVDLSEEAQEMVKLLDAREIGRVQHRESAGRSMETIDRELQSVDAMLAKARPDIASQGWDFKLVDGKLQVSGLAKKDAEWLEARLNSKDALVGAAKAFVDTAIEELETTDTNISREDYNYTARSRMNYTFYKVTEQLEDKLSFRALQRNSDKIIDSKADGYKPAVYRGSDGLDVVATLLTAGELSNQAKLIPSPKDWLW